MNNININIIAGHHARPGLGFCQKLPAFPARPAMEETCSAFLDYKTEKFVLTRNRKVGLLHRLLQLGILAYTFGWVLLFQKGYQEKDTDPHFSVITKLKGVSAIRVQGLGERLWDVADYVKPPQGESVFFLATNFITTPNQTQGLCPEHPSIPDGNCQRDSDCSAREPVVNGNGIKTGKCLRWNDTGGTCEIYGWCPVENKTLPRKPHLIEAGNFTLFIKNTVNFAKFNFSRTNVLKTTDGAYFKHCRYDALESPFCPVFRIRDMVESAGASFEELALKGAAVGLRIDWDCDADRAPSQCHPGYSFNLLDKGFNFRTASYYRAPLSPPSRSLLKLYGIRFDISVRGQAGKFSIVPTVVNVGTGAAFLGVATVVCDLVLLYLDAKADFYRSEKYEEAKPPKDKNDQAAS
nr:PREDICTED: P2X purinoceptor 6 isoform X1 [Anolis carolinensis]|eukprot:XP_003226866.2 PREDICTED: P2X purinoceptor 6 isoform X1 [Anolis carolinensis]